MYFYLYATAPEHYLHAHEQIIQKIPGAVVLCASQPLPPEPPYAMEAYNRECIERSLALCIDPTKPYPVGGEEWLAARKRGGPCPAPTGTVRTAEGELTYAEYYELWYQRRCNWLVDDKLRRMEEIQQQQLGLGMQIKFSQAVLLGEVHVCWDAKRIARVMHWGPEDTARILALPISAMGMIGEAHERRDQLETLKEDLRMKSGRDLL